MNFIFDIGNVLVTYNPKAYLEELFPNSSVIEKLGKIVFLGSEWENMDNGNMTHLEALASFCARAPELEPEICHTMENIFRLFSPINETVCLLPEIKKAGHSLYLLSNIHAEVRDYLLSEYEFFRVFEGGAFSCDIHRQKPDPGIYKHLLEKYSLNPNECIFFDDIEENVIAAQNEGIMGVHFTGAQCIVPLLT